MRQYPIWNEVQACIYKSAKNYGARNESAVTVRVGTSRSNSHELVRHKTTRRDLDGGGQSFWFWVDGVVIIKATVKNGVRTETFNLLNSALLTTKGQTNE